MDWSRLTLPALLNCWVWLIPRFVSLMAELQPSTLSCLPWKRKIIPWIHSCLPGDYWVLGCGPAKGFLLYLEIKGYRSFSARLTAPASPCKLTHEKCCHSISCGLVMVRALLAKSELCSSNSPLQSRGKHTRTLSSEPCWWKLALCWAAEIQHLHWSQDIPCISFLLQWERRVKNMGAGKGKVKYVKPLSCT